MTNTDIQAIVELIRTSVFAKDVRNSIADGIEGVMTIEGDNKTDTNGKIAEQDNKINQLQQSFSNLIINAGNSNAEIVMARDGFSDLKEMFDAYCYIPQKFGAKGDGVTDDTNAIQSAIDFINGKGGGILYITQHTFLISAPLLLYSNVIILGHGTIKLKDNSNCNIFITDYAVSNKDISIKDIKIDANKDNQTTAGAIYFSNLTDGSIENVKIVNAKGNAVVLQDTKCDILNANIKNSGGAGISLINSSSNIENAKIDGAGLSGVIVDGSTDVKITNTNVKNSSVYGVEVKGASSKVIIDDCNLSGNVVGETSISANSVDIKINGKYTDNYNKINYTEMNLNPAPSDYQTIPANTSGNTIPYNTFIVLNTVVKDNKGQADTTNNQIVIKETGIYLIKGWTQIKGDSTTQDMRIILKAIINGVGRADGLVDRIIHTGKWEGLNGSDIAFLQAGDTVKLAIVKESDTLSMGVLAGSRYTGLSVLKLS